MVRSWHWIEEQAAFLLVVLALAAAFAFLVIEPRHWREGSGAIGLAVLLAGVLRGALPSLRAGMLAVRTRLLDTVAYLALGGLILTLAIRLRG